MGAWAGKKDRQLLEDEGKELQKFLSGELGEDDRPDKSPFDEIALEEELNAPSLVYDRVWIDHCFDSPWSGHGDIPCDCST